MGLLNATLAGILDVSFRHGGLVAQYCVQASGANLPRRSEKGCFG